MVRNSTSSELGSSEAKTALACFQNTVPYLQPDRDLAWRQALACHWICPDRCIRSCVVIRKCEHHRRVSLAGSRGTCVVPWRGEPGCSGLDAGHCRCLEAQRPACAFLPRKASRGLSLRGHLQRAVAKVDRSGGRYPCPRTDNSEDSSESEQVVTDPLQIGRASPPDSQPLPNLYATRQLAHRLPATDHVLGKRMANFPCRKLGSSLESFPCLKRLPPSPLLASTDHLSLTEAQSAHLPQETDRDGHLLRRQVKATNNHQSGQFEVGWGTGRRWLEWQLKPRARNGW